MGASARKQPISRTPATFRGDRFTWTREQAKLLRMGRSREIDAVNIAAEIDDVESAEVHRMESASRFVLSYPLKRDFQPAKRTRDRLASTPTHRRRFAKQIRKNPGLKSELEGASGDAHADALDEAIQETNLPERTFRARCRHCRDEINSRAVTWPDGDETST